MRGFESVEGTIFNIQDFSIHDGPGIRTVVFLSGCPLRCWWCQNPESMTLEPKLFFLADKCSGCGACARVCMKDAVSIINKKASTDRSICNGCGLCCSTCLNDARRISGERKSAGEITDIAVRDKLFFDSSGGGVTLSGGEVLFQADFSTAILALCKDRGVHTAIETTGFGSWDKLSGLLEYTDLVLFDLKHMDNEMHKAGTGVGNELILENAERICKETNVKLVARVPIIPGFNDTESNVRSLCRFIEEKLEQPVKVHLLPYHQLGESKNDHLESEKPKTSITPPSDMHMEYLKNIISNYRFETVIGG